MSLRRKYLLDRLKAAYEANFIPVDTWTAAYHKCLSDGCLMENAIYWEARANGENPFNAITDKDALKVIRAAEGGAPPNGSTAGKRIAYQSWQYHGSMRE